VWLTSSDQVHSGKSARDRSPKRTGHKPPIYDWQINVHGQSTIDAAFKESTHRFLVD
jgi:hypothetical protein